MALVAWAFTGLSALGLALSAYLGWHSLMGGAVIGCGGGSSCDHVLSSRWSAVGGVLPVSGLAAGAYLAMLVASFFIGPSTAPADRRFAWGAILVLVGAAAGSAVWFIIVQKWLIGAFLPVLHGDAHHRAAAGGIGDVECSQTDRQHVSRCRIRSTNAAPQRIIRSSHAVGQILLGISGSPALLRLARSPSLPPPVLSRRRVGVAAETSSNRSPFCAAGWFARRSLRRDSPV